MGRLPATAGPLHGDIEMRTLILAALLLGGCAATAADAAASAPSPLPGYQARRSTLVHEATGMRFPARVGTAVREPSEGTHVENGYAIVRYRVPLSGGQSAIVHIGLLHLEGMTALEHYATYRGEIMARLPGASVKQEGPFAVNGAIGPGYRGSFVGTDRAAGLITAAFGYWSARLVTEYPAAQADEAQSAIAAFVEKMNWAPLRTRPADAPGNPLVGTHWQLVRIQSAVDKDGSFTPPDPSRYTLDFLNDETFAMRLDCNRGRGLWSASASSATEGSLTLGQAAMTRAACPPGAMDSRIAADTGRVRSYRLAGDMLTVTLEAESGVYTWKQLP